MVIEIEKSLPLNEVYLLPGTSAHQPQYINLSPGPSSESLKEETTAETTIQTQPIKPVVKLRRLGTVCYDYNAREQDELSLKHGSVVEIIKEECGEKGWILAQVDKKKGMIPKNYVALVGSQPSVINSEEVQRTNRSLGSGGFAEVFRGFFGGKEVALKVPNTCSTQNRETLTREALILSRISHKNIVEFYGLSLNPLFIILELCEGGTLFTLTCRKMSSSDVSTVISWARQVGEAIQYLHSRDDPVVYADLKAENVLVKEIPCECGLEDESWKIVTNYQRNGQCKKCHGLRIDLITLKLADFNVSRYHSVKRDSLAGSWPWMSPEVIKDKNVSESSDVWSFGSFLWEIFSRKIPFNNCEKQTIIYAILFKKEELLPLPLPKDLPGELQIIFEQCWRKNPIERPNIQEVLKLLELAEQSVDSNYKWIVKEEQAPKQEIDLDLEKDVIKNISQEYSEGKSVTISLEALMFMERLGVYQKFQGMIKKHGFSLNPTTPAKRQKKPKVDKESIGTPSDFRHNVSARLCSASPPHGESSSSGYSREKILEIRYLEDNEKPQHHRSHDSLIEQNKEEGQGPYCTLPKAFRQKVATLQNQEGHSSPIIFPKSDRIRHNSQAEHLNPKGRNRVCRLRHDYLTLGPCSCATGCRRTIIPNALKQRAGMASLVGARKEERSDNHAEANNKTSIDGSPTEDSKKEPEYLSTDEDTNRTLNRANAIRPKFGEQREQPQPAESTQSSDSSSSSVDGFVVVGDCGGDGGGDLHNSRDQPTRKHMNLPNLFNRRISPPQQIVQTPSSSSSSQNDFHQQKSGKEKRNRKASNEHKVANSTFHIPLKGDEELDVDEKTDPDSTPDSSRPRSAKLGWVNRIFGTSPRHSTADDTSEAVVQMARCHHPNHSYAETTHLCPLISGMNLLVPEINLSPVPELPIANHVIEQQPVPAIYPKGYKKRADYPEKLRQKQLLQRFEAMANAPPKKRAIIPAAELSGTKERLSMNTVIEIHHPNKNNAHHNYGPSDAPFSLPINSARSYTDLNGAHSTFCSSDQQKAKQNNALLSPDRILLDPLHQRSRSSDNPTFVHSPTTSDLVQKLLLPVPSNGPIPNPSYVPMRDSQKIDKRKLPPPPIPSKSNVVVKATVNVPPVPLPRTSIPRQQNTNGAANTPWPTSQAPVLSRDQRDSKLIARPDSLHLTPRIPHFPPNNASTPLTTPTTSNSLFTNSSASGGPLPSNLMPHCDSGIDPEAGTEADASPYPIEPRICEHGTTVFPSVLNISPRNQLPSAAIRRRSGAAFPGQLQPHAINPGIPPQLPTTPPPPLPPKRVVDGPRVPPIPNNIKKFNNRF